MTDPIFFDTTSPRFGLPLLFAGQAQKELFVNEAHALTDALLHCAIEGEAALPPEDPAEGSCWLIATDAGDAWAGHDGEIACRQAGQWLFAAPRDGMRVLDRGLRQEMRFHNGWQVPAAPVEPSGGSVVDTEARSAIVELLGALRVAGIFPQP